MSYPPSWSPERRATLARTWRVDPLKLPAEGQVAWDLALETFIPGSTWMWGSQDRPYYGVVEQVSAYTQGDGGGPRVGVWMGGKYAVPFWPRPPANLQRVPSSRVWAAQRTAPNLYYGVVAVPEDRLPADVLAAARARFRRGDRWVWGPALTGGGAVRQVETFTVHSPPHFRGASALQIGVRMIEDFLIPIWPEAPVNLQPDPADSFVVDPPDWRTLARPNSSKQARRFWAQAASKRHRATSSLIDRATDAVDRTWVDRAKPVAFHVTDFRLLGRIRREGLPADTFLTTEAGIPMWLSWVGVKIPGAKPVVLRVDTTGLRLVLDGEGTFDAIHHTATRTVGGRAGARLREVVAVQSLDPISPARITWSRPEVREASVRDPVKPPSRQEVVFPGGWKKNPLPWLDLSAIRLWLPLMQRLGVSEVARSPRGFLTAYMDVGGDPDSLPPEWHARRAAFIKRHMAQVEQRGEPLYKDGRPTRRHLALVAWAYSPDDDFNQRKVR